MHFVLKNLEGLLPNFDAMEKIADGPMLPICLRDDEGISIHSTVLLKKKRLTYIVHTRMAPSSAGHRRIGKSS